MIRVRRIRLHQAEAMGSAGSGWLRDGFGFTGFRWAGEAFAEVTPSGDGPDVWEIVALLGFDGLDGAAILAEEDAGAVRVAGESQALAVSAKFRVARREIVSGETEVSGNGLHFIAGENDLARPAAAGAASLACEVHLDVLFGSVHELPPYAGWTRSGNYSDRGF